LRDRIVFIGTPIDDYVANSIIAQLLFLQMEDPKKDIHLKKQQLHRLRQDILHDKTLDLVANKTKENISDTKGD
jgi:hypothetical protein